MLLPTETVLKLSFLDLELFMLSSVEITRQLQKVILIVIVECKRLIYMLKLHKWLECISHNFALYITGYS